MLFGGKTLTQLTEDDLQALVRDSVHEGDIVEYKRDMYGGDDESKREMLRDITAMANHKGGFLLIGMDEDDDGVAIAVLGVERDDHPARVTSSCLANIERRLFGLDVDEVALNNGRVVVAVRIPQSLTGPHMVTFKGLFQFWKRHGRQKERMSVDEIEAAFENRINAETRLERFLDERRRRTLTLVASLPTGKQPCLWLAATPVFVKEEFVDISEPAVIAFLQSPPSGRFRPSASVFSGAPVPTLSGLRADYTSGDGSLGQYLELRRNGHLEFCCLVALGTRCARPRQHTYACCGCVYRELRGPNSDTLRASPGTFSTSGRYRRTERSGHAACRTQRLSSAP